MSALDYLEKKINDSRTNARQMRDHANELLAQVARLRDKYLAIDKDGVAFTAFAVESSACARQELEAAVDVDALREIARRLLQDARSVELLLQNYY